MSKLYLLLMFIISIIILGCESKEMKDAKDFISLEYWENAVEKLQLEIKNNPKNVEAYKLLFVAQRSLYFDGYDINNFLNPNNASSDSFPQFNKEAADELFTIMDRIGKIDSNSVNANYLFFRALYRYYEYQNTVLIILANETDVFKQVDLQESLYEKRCENEIFKESISNFQKCAQTISDIADNAYFWLHSIRCDTSYKINNFIRDFRQKYKESDLIDEVDFLEFSENLRKVVYEYINEPDSTSINRPLELVSSFLEAHPNFKSGNDAIGSLIVDHVVISNREYVTAEHIYKYSNAEGLVEYLKAITKSCLNETIRIKALESIAEYYGNIKETFKQIEIYQNILDFCLNEDKSDELNAMIGKIYQDAKDYKKAKTHYMLIKSPSNMQKYYLWECFCELGETTEANKLRGELEKTDDYTVIYSIQMYDQIKKLQSYVNDLQCLIINDLDAEFDTYSIKVKGYVVNNLPNIVRNVKISTHVSDEYGNNTKESYDYIDIIYPGKKSLFEISVFYGSNCPSSIKYGARIIDYTKY